MTDPVLEVLVQAIDQQGSQAGLDLTLTTNGCLITGTVVGHIVWFRMQAALLAESKNPFGDVMSQIADQLVEEYDPADDDTSNSPSFIHLVDAVHFVGDTQLPNDQRAFWRGRLDSIDGWTLGRLGLRPEPTTSEIFENLTGG
jgi:hypothetical protein